MTNQRVLLLILTGLTVAGIVACGSSDSPSDTGDQNSTLQTEASPPNTTADTTAGRTYTAKRTVRSVPPSGSHVVINHEKNPGFMDAMTMPFRVSDTVSVDHLDTDDRVRFRFAAGDDGATIQSIEVVDEP